MTAVSASTFHGFTTLRRASEVFARSSGSVVDLVMLAAGLVELVGMQPALGSYTDRTVYLGVRAAPVVDGSPPPTLWALDLTGLRTEPFANALDDGLRSVANEGAGAPHFHVQDVAAARARGFFPLPR